MSHKRDIEKITEQENVLAFATFSERDALEIGLSVVNALEAEGKSGLVDVTLWDRQVFAFSMSGAMADNGEWVRRKINVVKRFQVSSYRKALEMMDSGKEFDASRGTDPMDYAAAGGAFPIRLKGGPVIGAVTLSGLPMRDDHRYVVDAIATHLGMDPAKFRLD